MHSTVYQHICHNLSAKVERVPTQHPGRPLSWRQVEPRECSNESNHRIIAIALQFTKESARSNFDLLPQTGRTALTSPLQHGQHACSSPTWMCRFPLFIFLIGGGMKTSWIANPVKAFVLMSPLWQLFHLSLCAYKLMTAETTYESKVGRQNKDWRGYLLPILIIWGKLFVITMRKPSWKIIYNNLALWLSVRKDGMQDIMKVHLNCFCQGREGTNILLWNSGRHLKTITCKLLVSISVVGMGGYLEEQFRYNSRKIKMNRTRVLYNFIEVKLHEPIYLPTYLTYYYY